jgi:TolB-like protein
MALDCCGVSGCCRCRARQHRPGRSVFSTAAIHRCPSFPSFGTATGDEALEVGLAEAVIVRLAQLKQLRVPSINAVQRYAKLDTDPRVAGRELDVEAVLDGSLLRANGSVRLSARLLDVKDGHGSLG